MAHGYKSVLSMLKSENTRMLCEAFSVSSIGQIPPKMVERRTSVRFDEADGKEQLKTLIEKMEEIGLKAQRVWTFTTP